ncbi:MAG: hypothetical protein GEU83_01685 [Pseudonocardiaceae bacterium]|nr:hypothetical protein [Pseudonocardiaceae bacterium]
MPQDNQELCYDPPELVAVCREDEDGEEQLAGWVMVLSDAAVAYVPDRNGHGAMLSTLSSLAAAERVLRYGELYLAESGSTS